MLTSASNIRKKAWALVKRFHHKRLMPLAMESTAVQHETTDSDLLAQVKEQLLEQQLKPRFNRKQRPFETRYGISDEVDSTGLLHLKIIPYTPNGVFHRIFASHAEARRTLKELSENNEIPDATGLFSGPAETHNRKVESAIQTLSAGVKRYLVFDKLTQTGDSTVFYIENEIVKGYCNINRRDNVHRLADISHRMNHLKDDPAVFRIVHRYIAKGKCRKVIYLDQS